MAPSKRKIKNKSIVRGLQYHNRVYRELKKWKPDELMLHVEPWLKHSVTKKMLQPDGVLVDLLTNTGYVIEVKMNWKDGRDDKLRTKYLQAVREAFGLTLVWPVLITSNVRGLKHQPRLGLRALEGCCDWTPGQPTPVLLLP